MKVAMVNSSGNVTIRIPRNDETKKLIRQMFNKNWQAAANTIVKHDELKPEIIKAMKKVVSEEVADYLTSESILLSRKSRRDCQLYQQDLLGGGACFLPRILGNISRVFRPRQRGCETRTCHQRSCLCSCHTLPRTKPQGLSFSLPNFNGVILQWCKARGPIYVPRCSDSCSAENWRAVRLSKKSFVGY